MIMVLIIWMSFWGFIHGKEEVVVKVGIEMGELIMWAVNILEN